MKRKLLLTLASCFCLLFFHLASATLDQIIQKSGKEAVMGVMVKDITTGRIIYQHNADRLFVPASSLKIYTGAAALIMLGPNYHFETKIYTDAPSVHPGMLEGNLYVVFDGDPTLTSADLFEVLSVLSQQSITHVKGNVIIVSPPYTGEKYAPGGAERDKIHPYGAPITPFILDQNAITFNIRSTGPGQLASITVDDPGNRIHVSNALYTKRPQTRACSLSYQMDEQNQIHVQGCITPRAAPYLERIALKNPMNYAQGVVAAALRHWQINVQGNVIPGQMPASVKLLNSHVSDALPVILADTLKPSNNVLANALFLKIGQAYWRQTATWVNSGQAVKQILEKYASVPMAQAILIDGAGLSRENRVTPRQSVELLSHMEEKFLLSDDFISALPVPGQKGTLFHRNIASPAIQSHIHAKTGTMRGIVGLAGYLPSANHHTLAFSIITNSTNPRLYSSDKIYLSAWKYRQLENEICRYLMNMNV